MKFKSNVLYHMIKLVQRDNNNIGGFFSAENTKTDGSIRKWSCRLGVKSDLRGGQAMYSAEDKNFITVWCSKAKMYRQLNVNTIINLQVGGKVIIENGEPTSTYWNYEEVCKNLIRIKK